MGELGKYPGFRGCRHFTNILIFVAREEEFVIGSYGATDQVIGQFQMTAKGEAHLLIISPPP
jgi:hypothetical protein